MSRAIVPLISVPDADNLGPAMQACTVGERAWVIAKIETGASNAECARLAGFSASTPEVLKSAGYMLAHREKVQAALLEMSRKLMRTEGPKSIKTLISLRDDVKQKSDIRMKCAVELLNRASLGAIAESHLTVTHELNESQLDQKILSLAAQLGIPRDIAAQMLITPADFDKNAQAIDADFEEVSPERTPEQQERHDRYEQNGERERAKKLAAMTLEEREASKAAVRTQRSEEAKARYAAAQVELEIPPELADLL